MDADTKRFHTLFIGSVAKDSDAPDQNEDVCASDEQTGVLALSDGAGESFDPQRWAGILVRFFLECPDPCLNWLEAAIADYTRAYDRNQLSWSGQAAFDRGSFATLLGARLVESELEILAIGDSLAVLLDQGKFIESFPYHHATDFARRPMLLATPQAANAALRDLDLGSTVKRWPMGGLVSPTLLCMTDALGAWLLECPQERCENLGNIRDETTFQALVREERAAHRMRLDDTTLAVLGEL